MTPGRLGLLGGTFDPIHVGHVAAAEAACRTLQLDEVWLLTSNVPPHRPQPSASVHHRFAMVALTVQDHPRMRASDFELRSEGPSYTSATLSRLHAHGFLPSQLFFIVGADAFAEIATWRDYPRFLGAANFAIVSRGGRPAAGAALELEPVRTRIRPLAPGAGGTAGAGTGADGTAVYLVEHETPDVSSTAVRERRARGESIAGLVTTAVERHILQHGLYASGAPAPAEPVGHLTPSHLHEQEHH